MFLSILKWLESKMILILARGDLILLFFVSQIVMQKSGYANKTIMQKSKVYAKKHLLKNKAIIQKSKVCASKKCKAVIKK